MQPILKWAGGKRRLAPGIVSHMRPFERYIEPMCGGAAVFWNLTESGCELGSTAGPAHFILADANKDLMNFYRVLRDQPHQMGARMWAQGDKLNNKDDYYALRDRFNDTRCDDPVERACLFLYLNATCFNGLWRVNSDGMFNVPFGNRKKMCIPSPEVFGEYAKRLEDATLAHADVWGTVEAHPPAQGDCWYFDPPYDGTFTGYHEAWDGEGSQRRILKVAEKIRSAGGQVLVSNADTPFIRELWKGWEIVELSANYSIRPHGDRGQKHEVLIKNR